MANGKAYLLAGEEIRGSHIKSFPIKMSAKRKPDEEVLKRGIEGATRHPKNWASEQQPSAISITEKWWTDRTGMKKA